MAMKPQRRRARGSLGALNHYLWAVVCYNLSVVEDDTLPHDLRQKAGNGLVQAGLAFMRAHELLEIDARLKKVEALTATNGHHR